MSSGRASRNAFRSGGKSLSGLTRLPLPRWDLNNGMPREVPPQDGYSGTPTALATSPTTDYAYSRRAAAVLWVAQRAVSTHLALDPSQSFNKRMARTWRLPHLHRQALTR